MRRLHTGRLETHANLTLNLGLRYEVSLPFLDKRDRMGVFDIGAIPHKPVLIPAGSNGDDRYNRAMFGTDKNNFMPRVGLAYKLGARTVLRSGYGIFYSLYGAAWRRRVADRQSAGCLRRDDTSSPTVPALTLAQGPPPGALDDRQSDRRSLCLDRAQADYPIFAAMELQYPAGTQEGRDARARVFRHQGHSHRAEVRRQFLASRTGQYRSEAAVPVGRDSGHRDRDFAFGAIYGYHFNGNSIYHALLAKFEKRFSGASPCWSPSPCRRRSATLRRVGARRHYRLRIPGHSQPARGAVGG